MVATSCLWRADKFFADNADFENMQKFRPLLEEQMTLIERRSIVQQTSERTATDLYGTKCVPTIPIWQSFYLFLMTYNPNIPQSTDIPS